jgi:hypothetical protein
MSSSPVFSRVSASRSLVFCAMLCRSLIVLFFPFGQSVIVLPVLQCTASDYPVGIFKLFVRGNYNTCANTTTKHGLREKDLKF